MTTEERSESKKKYQAAYRAKNREKLTQYSADYRRKNPEKATEYSKKYYQGHKEKFAEYAKTRNPRAEYCHNYYEANKDKLREYGRQWYKDKGKQFQEEQRVKNEAALVAKIGRPRAESCEICGGSNFDRTKIRYGNKFKTVLDHNHVTGDFRGWLCDRCNVVIGLSEDSPELLEKLAVYVRNDGIKTVPTAD